MLNLADKEAQKRGDQYLTSELFVLAALEDKGPLAQMLKDAGITRAAVERAIDEVLAGVLPTQGPARAGVRDLTPPGTRRRDVDDV